jgi:hypothetical protein
MAEFALLALVWAGVLWYVGSASRETMQMTWLIGLALMLLLTPIFALFLPMFR